MILKIIINYRMNAHKCQARRRTLFDPFGFLFGPCGSRKFKVAEILPLVAQHGYLWASLKVSAEPVAAHL